MFIRESKPEDFFNENGETIFVSTIHKAKGKEFDNVFLMLENFNPTTDASKRQLYVAMTRAKQNLTIHLNGNYLDNINVEGLERVNNKEVHSPPSDMVIQLTYKDIWLDYFSRKQHLISTLISGDDLSLNGDECLSSNGKSILKFSRHFANSIEEMEHKGYELKKAKVNLILYWKKEGEEQENKIILPELYFEKLEVQPL